MTSPLRLRDDPESSLTLRVDLERACREERPAIDLALGLAALEAAIVAGPPPAPPAPVTAAGSAVAPAIAAAIAKGALLGALAIGAASGVSALRGDGTVSPVAPSVAATAVAPAPGIASALPSGEVAPRDGAIDSASLPVAPPPQTTARRRAETSPSASVSAAPIGSVRGEPGALARETAEVTAIRAAAGADPARALALAEAAQREFPSGVFFEEREALAIASLARLGRTAEARARAESFLREHRASPFAAKLRSLTGLP